MDEVRRNTLTPALKAGQSRRQLGRLAGRLALGAALASLASGSSEARKRKKRKWASQVTFGSVGTGADQFQRPYGLFVSADGLMVYVVDSNNNRISIWKRSGARSKDWAFRTTFGTEGSALGQLRDPFDVAVSRDELTAWVADAGNDRVSVWKRKSKSSTVWVNRTTFGTHGTEANQFRNPRGIAITRDGKTLFVSDFDNHRVSAWNYS